MRKITVVIAICFVLCFGIPVFAANTELRVSADAAVLMDWETGMVLYEKCAHVLRHPASLTKMLTAIVAVEASNLQDIVTITDEARSVPGSTIGFRSGQRYTMEDMLHMLLLESGNDAAVAIAVHVSGGVEDFALAMNQKARSIGALSTTFSNPHGLTEPNHLTTAYDLALIARHALSIPFIERTVSTMQADVDRLDHDSTMRLQNTNRLLWNFPGSDGVKTGTTAASGNSLAASASRDGHRLIGVVLHSDDRYKDAASILDYGFTNFSLLKPYEKGDMVCTMRVEKGTQTHVPLVAAETLAFVLPKELARSAVISEPPGLLSAPLGPDTVAGEISISLGGKTLATVDVHPKHEVKKASVFGTFYSRVLLPALKWFSPENH